MKVNIQPTQITGVDKAVTVNVHDDDGTEIILFNAVVTESASGFTLKVEHSTREWPKGLKDAISAGTMDEAGEALANSFVEATKPPPVVPLPTMTKKARKTPAPK